MVTKYYSFAGQTVAMKEGSTFKYFVSDHLGSTALVLSASGTILEQQRYLPFGTPRSIPSFNNITSTDFTYTGQRLLDAGMGGIMDYKARFYSPALGRFVQPDTIIPDHSDPQSWNRFGYGLNNPVIYSDPTGHFPWLAAVALVVIAVMLSGDSVDPAIVRANAIADSHQQLIADRYSALVANSNIDDLEKSARLIKYAAELDSGCVSCFVHNVGAVVTGHDDLTAPFTDVFNYPPNSPYHSTGINQSGFSPTYQDPQSVVDAGGGKQLHHYWYYVQLGFELNNKELGYELVDAHEEWLGNPVGRSTQDKLLGYQGIDAGIALNNGDLTPSEMPDYIRKTLSPHSYTGHYAR